MKAFLMYPDQDFELQETPVPNAPELVQDLELETLIRAMAMGDAFLLGVARSAVLLSLRQPEPILYRQAILTDCMEHPDVVREVYSVAVEAIEREKSVWGWMSGRYPEGTLHRCVDVLEIFAELLFRLRTVADTHAAEFRSEGFERFFSMLSSELDDEYLGAVSEHLRQLRFRDGLLMSAKLGEGNKGAGYVLRKPPYVVRSWFERLRDLVGHEGNGGAFVYEVDDRDEAGLHALSELRARGIAHVAAALAQSTDHILSFFELLRRELGFYVGCLNLRDRLLQKSEPFCLPVPTPSGGLKLAAHGLYDICLSLSSEVRVVGNDLDASGKALVMITGANRGGKSTLLRAIGLAHLMMQCGMFVPASSFHANLSDGLYTHFKRKEDATMKSGKLDEELGRMSGIVDLITPGSLVLMNESFASTNEREGSEIAREIVHALLEMGIKVIFVTHMFDLAHGFVIEERSDALFLRAERLAGGERTFRLLEAEPLRTSYGQDLYSKIFGATSNSIPSPKEADSSHGPSALPKSS